MALPNEKSRGFTYADYLTWPDEERWEIIRGVPYDMSPAPATSHQYVQAQIIGILARDVSIGNCTVLGSPTDVILPALGEDEGESSTVVQPDVLVVCRPERITDRAVVGPPDLVVEILSPSTGFKDQSIKFDLYERCGVREYWVINPETRVVEIFVRSGEVGPDGSPRYGAPRWYRDPGEITSDVLGGVVDLTRIWRTE